MSENDSVVCVHCERARTTDPSRLCDYCRKNALMCNTCGITWVPPAVHDCLLKDARFVRLAVVRWLRSEFFRCDLSNVTMREAAEVIAEKLEEMTDAQLAEYAR